MATPSSIMWVKDCIDRIAWSGPVIDLGSGRESKYYKPYFVGHEYVKLDLEADPNDPSSTVGDILNMPQVKSNFYGVVLLLEVLEHVPLPFKAFREISRILRPGGLFICTTVASWPEHKHPKDYWRFLPDGLAYLAVSSGLKVLGISKKPYGRTGSITCCMISTKSKQ